MATLEHINITVSDPAATAALYRDIFDWQIRWQGASQNGGRTIHVGSRSQYLAIWGDPSHDRSEKMGHSKGAPLNHFGVVVDDLDKTEHRIKAKGIKTFSHGDYEPGRRFYFFDPDGVEVEVISYKKSMRCVLDHLAFK